MNVTLCTFMGGGFFPSHISRVFDFEVREGKLHSVKVGPILRTIFVCLFDWGGVSSCNSGGQRIHTGGTFRNEASS